MEQKDSNYQGEEERSSIEKEETTAHVHSSYEDKPYHVTNDHRKEKPILVLVNPHSGRGKSLLVYRKKLLKHFATHNIEHQLFVTEKGSRIVNFIKSKTLAELVDFKTILVVSGDGLLYETINAIMARPDWEKAMNIPLALVPTGSGNGMAFTLVRQNHPKLNDFDDVLQLCMDQAISNDSCNADLVKITYGINQTVWSFLSIGWGLLADIDIDSEWLRSLGELRFIIYGLLRSVTSTSYRGKLSYKVAKIVPEGLSKQDESIDNSEPDEAAEQDLREDWVHIEDKFACLYAVHQSHVSRVTNFAPKSTLRDSLMYLTYVRGKLSICRAVEFLLAIDDGSHERLPYVEVIPVSSFEFQPLEPSKVVVDGEVIPWTVEDGPISATVVPNILRLRWNDQKSD